MPTHSQLLNSLRPPGSGGVGGTNFVSTLDPRTRDRSLLFLKDMGRELHEDMERMKEVMIDLEAVLQGLTFVDICASLLLCKSKYRRMPPELLAWVLRLSCRLQIRSRPPPVKNGRARKERRGERERALAVRRERGGEQTRTHMHKRTPFILPSPRARIRKYAHICIHDYARARANTPSYCTLRCIPSHPIHQTT